jgi:hypothetical protein
LSRALTRGKHVPAPAAALALSLILLVPAGAGAKQARHDDRGRGHVVKVMTRDPKQIKLRSSSVTGRRPVHGFWDSDHAGLFSSLRFVR